jgi:hypothetical protein
MWPNDRSRLPGEKERGFTEICAQAIGKPESHAKAARPGAPFDDDAYLEGVAAPLSISTARKSLTLVKVGPVTT